MKRNAVVYSKDSMSGWYRCLASNRFADLRQWRDSIVHNAYLILNVKTLSQLNKVNSFYSSFLVLRFFLLPPPPRKRENANCTKRMR